MINLSKEIKIYKEYKGAYILKGKKVYEFSEDLFALLNYFIEYDLNSVDLPKNIEVILEHLISIGIIERSNDIVNLR